ncbi:MAG: DUF4340 domain-containing protein [Mariniblastus sp.]
MNSPIFKTLLMGVMAAVTSVAAAYFYPWPEIVKKSALVGSPLFEAYDSTNVRSIQILEYNDDDSALGQIRLERSGEKWVIPSKRKYIADNTPQVSLAANSLSECIVLEERTDQQKDYLEYGVVDPSEFANSPNKSALGSKIILEDRNRKELASLIIGKPLKDGMKHFARIPGQPTVYVVEFDTRAIKTDFKSWVNPNLFQLSNQFPLSSIVIENYSYDTNRLASGIHKNVYRAKLVPGKGQLDLAEISRGDGKGGWEKSPTSPNLEKELGIIGTQLGAIQFPDVFLKSKEVVAALQSPKKEIGDAIFQSLESYGFRKKGFSNGMYEFDSATGEVHVEFADGVIMTLHRGAISSQSAGNLRVSNYVMLTASVDESVLPQPEPPATDGSAEEADKANKAYLRLVEARKTAVKSAQLRAAGFNQQHAKWIYVVSEEITEKLIPDVTMPKSKSDPNSKMLDQLKASNEAAKSSPANDKKPDPETNKDEKTDEDK